MSAPGTKSVADEILAMEQAALDRWCRGDPSGFLEICSEDVVYFDPFIERRIDGLSALTAHYEKLRGTIAASRHEVLVPVVQHSGDMAVLTFHFVSNGEQGDEGRWNCTEVYRHEALGWRIIQSHWSLGGGRG